MTGALLLLLVSAASASTVASAAPNLVLISVDGLRADRVGPRGGRPSATPAIDRLAAQGLVCEVALSQSNESLFSHAALLTGRPVSELGRPDYRRFTVPPSAMLLPEILALYGYSSGAFVAGGHVKGVYGFDQGFSVYADEDDFGSFFHTVPPALEWLRRTARAPFFLFLHGYDTHRPYQHAGLFDHVWDADYTGDIDTLSGRSEVERIFDGVYYPDFPVEYFWHGGAAEQILDPSGYARLAAWAAEHPGRPLSDADQAHLLAHYDTGALSADVHVGRFVEALKARGLWQDTLLLLTADHGEDLGEHGFFNHRSALLDSTTRVPLILAGGALPAALRGQRLPGPCSALDVVPTLLAAAGATPPAGLEGQDLLHDPVPTAVIVQEGVLPMMAVRTPTHRLVVQGIPLDTPLLETLVRAAPIEAPTFRLYDLRTDPEEQVDQLSAQRPVALELRAALLRWLAARARSSHEGGQPVDAAFQEVLRSRGYW